MNKRETHTENFLISYRIRQLLAEVSGGDEDECYETGADIPLCAPAPFDTDLQTGQIRILRDAESITYVVLLEKQGEDAYLTVPFSHYDDPATDQEFKTGYDGGMYLRVLQLWNKRTLHTETLEQSWLVGELPAADCEDARQLLHAESVPARILDNTGTPLDGIHDIRRQYMHEERAVFRKIDEAEVSRRSACIFSWDQYAIPPLWEQEEWSLAAGEEQQNRFVECMVEGYGEVISVEYSPQGNKLLVKVYTASKDAYSPTFDGWDLVGVDTHALGQIARGRCVVAGISNFDGMCALREPGGRIHVFDCP